MAQVLLVDDEESIRLTLGEFLRSEGHDVVLTEDAEQAMAVLRDADVDVVIADIILPGLTGLDLLKHIHETAPGAQVIMITGEPTAETASESLRAGAFDYLAKPVAQEAIVNTVANAAKIKTLEDGRKYLEEQNREYQERLVQLVDTRTYALRESEKRYRRLVDHAPDGIAILCDGEVVSANDTMAQMLGAEPPNLIGRKSADFVHPDHLEAVQREVSLVREGEQNVRRFETVLTDLGGDAVQVEIVALPFSHDGKPGTQVVVRDITEERFLEEQLRQSQKMEAIGQLAGGVAHDFNNILTGMSGYTRFALAQAQPESQLHEDLTEIGHLTKRATGLTRQLLAFSRRQTLKPVVQNMNSLIADVTRMLGRLIGEDVKLEFVPDLNLGNTRVDPGQMEQVLVNLALNARDAMPKGGELTIRTANVNRSPAYAAEQIQLEPGPYVLLSVTDTGVGMDAATRERIFDPFFTTKDPGKGTGLGLSTVYGIVKQHGGSIWVYSEPGQGTTFEIHIPRVPDEAEAEAPEPIEKPVPVGTEMLLIAEDDPEVRFVAERSLTSRGYTVLTAPSATEAEAIFEGQAAQIALLLTDVIMPGRTGRELCDSLRHKQPHLKVIFMSGYTDDTIAHHGVLEPGTPFMEKPFDPDDLARLVREVLDS